jgi:hypothetical protein
MTIRIIRAPFILLLVLIPFLSPCAVDGGSAGGSGVIFESDFADTDWGEGLGGDASKWEALPVGQRVHLRSKGAAGSELVVPLGIPEGEAVGVELDYGFLWGRGGGTAAVIFSDAAGKEGLRVDVRQGEGEKQYRVIRFRTRVTFSYQQAQASGNDAWTVRESTGPYMSV